MRILRFFAPSTLCATGSIALSPDQRHHMKKVLRLETGATIELLDGEGHSAEGTLSADGSIHISTIIHHPAPRHELVLGAGILKHDAMDTVIRMATEIGVTHFFPVLTERSNSRWNEDRARRITDESLKQCGRYYRMTLHSPITMQQLDQIPCARKRFIMNPQASYSLAECVLNQSPSPSVTGSCLLIGPEGGFTEQEIEQAHQIGYTSARMNTPILRADTAVIAALSMLLAHGG